MSWREKTIKTPKTVENIKVVQTIFSKDSRSLFARQLDIFFYVVNKVIKQDLKMTKIWFKFVQSLWQRTKERTLIMDLKSKPEKSSKSSYLQYSISHFFWSRLKGLKQTLMDQAWYHSENVLTVTNGADIFAEERSQHYD